MAPYVCVSDSTVGVYTNDEVIDKYMPELQHILESAPNYGKPPEPSEIFPGLKQNFKFKCLTINHTMRA